MLRASPGRALHADREQDRVAEPAADQQHGLPAGAFRLGICRACQDYRLAAGTARLERYRRREARHLVDRRPGLGELFHRQGRAVDLCRERFVILQRAAKGCPSSP